MREFITNGAQETMALAQELAKECKGGETILLSGEMGAGKTAFAKGFARGLGVEEEVTSPTYAYMNEYEGKGVTLYHYDCYRIESVEQAEGLGLADYFTYGGVCLVEWWKNILPLLPENCIEITIEKTGEEQRRITLS